jgi:glycosyltransferase involved in cell wall biosynthesis
MIIVSSDSMAHGLQKVGFPADRVHVIRPAVGPLFATQASLVSEDEKARIRATLGLPSSATLLLYLGGTNPMRGADLAINVASALRKRAISNNRLPFGDPRLVILARPATRNYEQQVAALVSQARVLGMEDALVVVSGMLPPSQVRDYIDASDAAILPFRIVPSDAPLAVLECLARGRLVVASALDGVPEMLADGRGIAVLPHDFAAKADSVAGKLASALADRNFLGSLAIQAPAYVHRLHSPSVMAESVSQVFSPALAEAGLRPGRVGEDTR